MDFINLNFEVRNKNLNSDEKKDVKNKKDIPIGENIQPELAKPNSELLKAYSNVVSFKGEDLRSLQSKHKSTFAKFNNDKAWDYFRNTLCSEYSDDEVDALLDEISAKRSDDKDVFKKFYNLININQVENITYGDGIQDPTTKKTQIIKIHRALTPIEAKELIVSGLTKNADVQQYLELRQELNENKIRDVELKGSTDTIGVAKLIIKNGINKSLYEGFVNLTDAEINQMASLSKIEIEKELKRQISINEALSKGEELSEEDEFKSHFTEVQRKKYEILMNDETIERPLDKNEILACVLFDLSSQDKDGVNQINNFINLRDKHTDLTELEIAHLIKLGINQDDEDRIVNSYKELKSKPEISYKDGNEEKTYKLLPQEALICAKENLDAEQLKKFAQFKHSLITIDAVRKRNEKLNLSPQLIINYIKNNKTANDVVTELRLYKILETGVDINAATLISKSQDLSKMFCETASSEVRNEILRYARKGLTTQSQIETYKKAMESFDEETAIKFAKEGSADNITKVKELMAIGISVDDSISLANNQDAYDRYKNLLNGEIKTSVNDVVELATFALDGFDELEKYNEIKKARPDIHNRTLVQIIKHPEYSKLLKMLNLNLENGKPLFMNSNVLACISNLSENPDVSDGEFEKRIVDIHQKHFDIPLQTLPKIANHSEYEKMMKLLSKEPVIISGPDLGIIVNSFNVNPDVSGEDFIARAIDIQRKRPNISAFGLVKIANSSRYSDLVNLLELKDGNYHFFSDDILSMVVDEISKNPDISVNDFIQNAKDVKEERKNITQQDLIKVASHYRNEKFSELFDLVDKNKKPIFSNSELSSIASKMGKNPEISIEEYIERVKALKKSRPDDEHIGILGEFANHPEYPKLLMLMDLKDENNSYIIADRDLEIYANAITKNPDVSPKEFINRVKELKQKNVEINDYDLCKIANHSEYSKILEMQNGNDKNLSIIASAIVENPDVSIVDFAKRYEEINKQDINLSYHQIIELAVHSECSKILKLIENEGISSDIVLSHIISNMNENPDISTDDFINRFEEIKQKIPFVEVDKLVQMANNSEYKNIISLIEQGIEPEVALDTFSNEKYLKLLNTTKKLSPSQAVFLALNTSIDSLDSKVLDNLNSEILYNLTAGTSENTFVTLASAMLKLYTNQDITTSPMTEKDINLDTIPEKEVCSFDEQTANFEYTGTNAFNVNLKKAIINDNQVMVISNNENDEKYVAYDGAITLVKQPLYVTKVGKDYKVDEEKTQRLKDSLNSHSNISSKQTEILAEAIRHFIVKVADDDGNCIISDGLTLQGEKVIEPFNGSELNDEDTKQKYTDILEELGENVTIEDILKIMPKDSILQINPFITDANMLFSISSEWQSKDGTWWQMRVHSQDLKFIDDPKEWIYRLGYTQGDTHFFYNPTTSLFEEGMKEGKTHVKTKTVDNDSFNGKLIANPYFQNIFRNISVSFNETNKIEYLASQLGVTATDYDEKINEILKKCYENIENYFRFKDEIDGLLAQKGLSFF